MGEVWLATEVRLGRKVALKLLPPDLTPEPSRVQRFEQEARAASALNHPNVCHIYALGATPDGEHYIAMELVEGETLRQRLSTTRLSIREALDIAIQVAAALSAAHGAGIVHRDIKPENVMLRPDGFVKVLDFGLAKLAPTRPEFEGTDSTRTVLKTEAGVVVGTTAYMSPEQARGQELDARTDLWSLGTVLYELVSGRAAFGGGTTSNIIAAILEREPTPLRTLVPGVPPELERIIGKALEKNRDERYQASQELLLDLQALRKRLRGDHPSSDAAVVVDETAEREKRNTKRRHLRAVIVMSAILIAFAGSAAWWAVRRQASSTAPATRLESRRLARATVGEGLQTDVTWSPDGQSIAYAADRAGNFDIWIQRLHGGVPIRLTKSPADERQPSWSPDGNTIVFRSDRGDGGIFAVSSRGGAERQLAPFGFEPKWAPDGSQILFASSELSTGIPHLYTVRLHGEAPREVLQSFFKSVEQFQSWNWHPDSKRISFVGKRTGQDRGVYTVALSGDRAVLLTYPHQLWPLGKFTWSRSGTSLYVECGQTTAVCRLDTDPSGGRIITTQRVTAGGDYQTAPVVSPDGKRLAMTMIKLSSRLWSIPFDATRGQIKGSGVAVTGADAHITTASLSDDGMKLAYVVVHEGSERTDLWVADLATGKHRQLSDDEQAREAVVWSHDGSKLAYAWIQRQSDGRTDKALAVRRMDTDEERLISPPQSAFLIYPSDWSPDDQSVLASRQLLHSRNTAVSLTVWPLAAAPTAQDAATVLAADPHMDLWGARYSPNRRWIAFNGVHRDQAGKATIFVTDAEDADRNHWTVVANSADFLDKPRWSPDGRLLFYLQLNGAFLNVWGRRFDVARGKPIGEPFQVSKFNSVRHRISPEFEVTDLNVSRTRLILPIMETAGSIWVLDNIDR
jgi:Tol biopolymer transport system component